MTKRIENKDGRLNHMFVPFYHAGLADGEDGLSKRTTVEVEGQARAFVKKVFLRQATKEEQTFAVQVYGDGYEAGRETFLDLVNVEA